MHWLAAHVTREHLMLALSVGWSVYVLVVGVWILLQRRAPVATLSWLLSMAALPVLGLAVYFFFGPQRLRRQRIRRLRSRRHSRPRHSQALLRDQMPDAPERLQQVVRLVATAGHFPISSARQVQLLVGGADTFDSILQAVRAARHHVHLEYYIFEPDRTGLALLQALQERARAGAGGGRSTSSGSTPR